MANVNPLKIGDLTARVPVIQGGMGVGVSLSSLAGNVVKEGGIGVISTAQIGYREPDFDTDPIGANLRAIGTEIAKAREIAKGGASISWWRPESMRNMSGQLWRRALT